MMMRLGLLLIVSVFATVANGQTKLEALQVAKRAVAFLTEEVSIDGGYLWRYSADLSRREGEGRVTTRTVWVQPPGTPAVGNAFLDLYQATQDVQFLNAALQVSGVLRKGQMSSGGWQAMIHLEPMRSRRWAYRVNPPSRSAKDQSSLDDNKTQACLHFLIRLDQTLDFADEDVHEMTSYGLRGLVENGQLPGGGFPQVWTNRKLDRDPRITDPASYPDEWSRVYTGHHEYWFRYTLNDDLAGDVARVLILAREVYDDDQYFTALKRFADSLIRAQMPDPQPAWAQQYSDRMQPTWARKFEPPAIVTRESYGVIRTLMLIHAYTGEQKYLEPIPRALDYLETCRLGDGKVARFYELKTNRPLYLNRKYELTYDDDELPTHYGFKTDDQSTSLRRQFQAMQRGSGSSWMEMINDAPRLDPNEIAKIINGIDDRGAWITEAGLRFFPGQDDSADRRVIEMKVAVENLCALAAFLNQQVSGDLVK